MGLGRGPELLFLIVPQRKEGVTQLIQGMVCVRLGGSLNLSNLSRLRRTLLNPSRKHPILPGNEDSVGGLVPMPGGAGLTDGRLPLWAILLSCLFQNQFFQVLRLCLPLCRSEEGKSSGLEGRTG